MVRFTIIEHCVNNLKEISKQKVIAKLFGTLQRKRTSFIDEMNEQIFGFAIYDVEKDEYFIAGDHMGNYSIIHRFG
jgi:asparagine synthetase B (glutamine-hydrolysing)